MNYITDTHTLIWSVLQPNKLSSKTKRILENPENRIFVSSVNFWEVSLKYALGKLELKGIMPHELPSFVYKMGFELISITPEEAASYHLLRGNWHKDPFDKMLIWQAIKRDYILLSKDKNVAKYKEIGLKIEW